MRITFPELISVKRSSLVLGLESIRSKVRFSQIANSRATTCCLVWAKMGASN